MKKYIRNTFPDFYKKLARFKNNLYSIYLGTVSEDKYEREIKRQYLNRTGKKLNLENPKTYTEKMQYAKLYKNNPIKTELSDKYLVRDWVKDKIGEEYLIPLLGVWRSYKEIDFSELPNSFVLKTNHGSGTLAIVKDKKNLNYRKLKRKFNKWMNTDYTFSDGIQLHYSGIDRRIIAEEYIVDSDGQLNDYKFLCFNGEVYFCWIDIGRFGDHYRNVYDLNWQLQEWNQHTYENYPGNVKKPKNFERMKEIAKKLCQGFSHVRVDLYNVDGKIYFGEMTFTNSSGFELIYPEEYNLKLGQQWDLNNKK